VNFRRLRSGLGLVAFLLAASAGAGIAQVAPNPNAPPPPPLPNATFAPAATAAPATAAATPQATFAPAPAASVAPAGLVPTPFPSPSSRPRRGHKAEPTGTPAPDETDTPEPPQFTTIDGIWEIEIQPLGRRLALYEHFSLVQHGSTLSGYWEHNPHKTRTPVVGTFDGRLFQVTAQTETGPVTFSGYVENMADMVGMKHVGPADPGVAFTAQHRKKSSLDVPKEKPSPGAAPPPGGMH
jgi:hypothetical protein